MNRQAVAALWYEMVCTAPASAFGHNAHRISDDLAQPGYVGKNFEKGGILLVGLNPAGGGTGKENDLVYSALWRLTGDVVTFDRLNDTLASVMPSWPIFANVVVPLLSAVSLFDR